MDTLEWLAPDACTLPIAEQLLRVAELDDLFASHLVGVERTGATSARLTLSGLGRAGLAVAVRDLTDRESRCCSFLRFAVTSTDDAVLLDIEVPPARADLLAALVRRAETAAGPTGLPQDPG